MLTSQYYNGPYYSDRQVWAISVDPVQTGSNLT